MFSTAHNGYMISVLNFVWYIKFTNEPISLKMESRNYSDFSGKGRCPFSGDAFWRRLQTDLADTGENRPNTPETKCINLRRKGVRKREKGSDYYYIIQEISCGILRMKVSYTVTLVMRYLAYLVCVFILNCYTIIVRALLRTKGNDAKVKHWSYCRRTPWCKETSSPKSKLCSSSSSCSNNKNSYSVILSVIIISSLSVMTEGFCPSGCNCDDDALSVNCENASLQVVPILLNPNVKTILLTRNKIQQLSQSLVFYTNLKKLDISYNEIKSLGKKNFEAQQELVELRLSNNRLTTLESTSLQGLAGVRVLLFVNNRISTIEDGAFIGLDSLIELDLSKNKLKILGENSFNALPSLWTLNLSGNKLGSVPSGGLNNLSSLLELDLSDNQISQVPGRAFSGVAKLSHLVLDKNNISFIDTGAFSGLCELSQLSLKDNRLFQVPSMALSGLPDLHELDLSGNLFETLPQDCFAGLSSLSSLTVSRCPRLSSVSSEAFLSTGDLETLVMSHNPHLSSLSPAAFASLLSLRHVDLTACGLLYLTPTQVPVHQLLTLRVSGNPLHCNCSLLWLARLTSDANSSSITIDQPTCASPPTLYGVSLRELGEGGVGCDGRVGLLTILICVGVAVAGLAIIIIFLLCRWRRKKKKEMKKRNGQDKTLGMWSDVWRPENHLSTTQPPNGDTGGGGGGGGGHYQLPSPTHQLRSAPRLPPDHPLHHLHHHHHHHQGCLQQCPYAALHPVYHPLLHPDHNSTTTTLETPPPPILYGDYAQTYINTNSPVLSSRSPPIPLNDAPNWYETISSREDGVHENGRESRPMTPLDLYNNSPRKVPVTYV